MIRPRFRAYYGVEVISPSHVLLLSEQGSHLLTGTVYAELAPWLDGRHELDDVLEEMEPLISAPETYYALLQLEAAGHLADSAEDGVMPHRRQAGWDLLGLGSAAAEAALARSSVGIRTFGFDPRFVSEAVQAAGIREVNPSEGELLIVVVDDYLRPELAVINRSALQEKRPWILLKPVGLQLWIGPLFSPGQNGCWECLAQRLRSRQQVEKFLARTKGESLAPGCAVAHPSAARIAAQLLSGEIVKWFTGGRRNHLEERLLSFDLGKRSLSEHVFIRRPQCAECGDPIYRSRQEPEPVALECRRKGFEDLGGHSTRTPEEAIARYQCHVSPITGVITSIREAGGVRGLFHGYVATHDFPIWTPDIDSLQRNLIGRSSGEGATEAEGKLSAIGEALERYSGVWQGEEEIVTRSCARDLEERAIDLAQCLLFSEAQLRHRADWNAAQKIPNQLISKPLDAELEIDWSPLRSLHDGRIRYLPSAFCYYGHPDMHHLFCLSDSNGCAAGNTFEEAVLSALIELIERDTVAIWWYNRIQRPGVLLDSFDLPHLRNLEKYYRTLGRDLSILDITGDLGIATFVASSAVIGRSVQDVILGFGSHLDPKHALTQAVSEMNQSYEAVSTQTGSGESIYRTPNRDAIEWYTKATRESESYLNPDPHAISKTYADYKMRASNDIREDIELCLRALSTQRIEVFVLNQTRPDLGVPACRVVAPGLRHFWRRLAPGRLYDVPVSMGWLPYPKTEAELNPWSIFF